MLHRLLISRVSLSGSRHKIWQMCQINLRKVGLWNEYPCKTFEDYLELWNLIQRICVEFVIRYSKFGEILGSLQNCYILFLVPTNLYNAAIYFIANTIDYYAGPAKILIWDKDQLELLSLMAGQKVSSVSFSKKCIPSD